MFWKGKVPLLRHLEGYLKQQPIILASDLPLPEVPMSSVIAKCTISVASIDDCNGISRLLNDEFDRGKVKTNTTPDWIRSTYLEHRAIWLIAKDTGGTVRACISSFEIESPYPNSLRTCGGMNPWGLVDWFCVHPLWRGKGIASNLLETLDYITYTIGRKAHIFLKEGIPLPLPHIPVYATVLYCRKAGTSGLKQMREGTGLLIHEYHCVERATGIPMVRVEGLDTDMDLQTWENALDTELPECWIFVSGSSVIDMSRGWKPDSLVSMYAFRWVSGKWLGKRPDPNLL
jgi:hypothetical protein